MKTTVMMAGEFEYSDLYKENETDDAYAPIVSRFLFLMFIILNSIVLMNLMIALAASDIQTLQVSKSTPQTNFSEYLLIQIIFQ